MNREQMIDILKNGVRSEEFIKNVFVSFGQLPPEVQAVAKSIDIGNFDLLMINNQFIQCGGWTKFEWDRCYRLRPDYIDPPKPMTKPEIIKYLEESEVAPGQWPEAVKRYALEIEKYCMEKEVFLFEHQQNGTWYNTKCIMIGHGPEYFSYPHRLKKGVWPAKVEPELEYLEIILITSRGEYKYRPKDYVWPNGNVESFHRQSVMLAPGEEGFLGYAKTRDQKSDFSPVFTSDMKFVVLLKKG